MGLRSFPVDPFVGCFIRRDTNQSIANVTFTAILWDTEIHDALGMHDQVTNTDRVTVPVGKSGYYQVNVGVLWAINGSGVRRIYVQKNGVTVLTNQVAALSASYGASNAASVVLSLVAGDYVSVGCYQDCGVALNLVDTSLGLFDTWISLARVGLL